MNERSVLFFFDAPKRCNMYSSMQIRVFYSFGVVLLTESKFVRSRSLRIRKRDIRTYVLTAYYTCDTRLVSRQHYFKACTSDRSLLDISEATLDDKVRRNKVPAN